MRYLIYILAIHISVTAFAQKPSGRPGRPANDHYNEGENRGGGGGNRGARGERDEEAKPRPVFSSFGDSLRAADERHQAQVDAILTGQSQVPRGGAERGVFRSFQDEEPAPPPAKPSARRDAKEVPTENPGEPRGGKFER